MLNKKIIASLVCAMTMLTSFPTFASTITDKVSSQSETLNIEEIDVDKLSKDNNVDSEELQRSIEQALKSTKFSPFSEIESKQSEEQTSSDKVKNSTLDKIKSNIINKYSLNWNTKVNQDSTAYTSSTSARTASGVKPKVGMAAVHQYSTGTPYIPFGTTIYFESTVNIQGDNYAFFDVEDTGDLRFKRTSYWTDLYFGTSTSANNKAALNYGIKKINYGYYS